MIGKALTGDIDLLKEILDGKLESEYSKSLKVPEYDLMLLYAEFDWRVKLEHDDFVNHCYRRRNERRFLTYKEYISHIRSIILSASPSELKTRVENALREHYRDKYDSDGSKEYLEAFDQILSGNFKRRYDDYFESSYFKEPYENKDELMKEVMALSKIEQVLILAEFDAIYHNISHDLQLNKSYVVKDLRTLANIELNQVEYIQLLKAVLTIKDDQEKNIWENTAHVDKPLDHYYDFINGYPKRKGQMIYQYMRYIKSIGKEDTSAGSGCSNKYREEHINSIMELQTLVRVNLVQNHLKSCLPKGVRRDSILKIQRVGASNIARSIYVYVSSFKEYIARHYQDQADNVLINRIDNVVGDDSERMSTIMESLANRMTQEKIRSIRQIEADKPSGWIMRYYQEITDLRKNYREYISDSEYAELLLRYSDFVNQYGLTKEFKENIDLTEGWFNTIVEAYADAVDKAKACKDDDLYFTSALRYAAFMTKYGQADQYEKTENLFREMFTILEGNPQLSGAVLMATVLRSYALLCYLRGNIDLTIETLERAKKLCHAKDSDAEYLPEYLYVSRDLAGIFSDPKAGSRRDINRSIKEYKDITDSVKENQSYDYGFMRRVYRRLAGLLDKSGDYSEEEKIYEKCVMMSLSYAEHDCSHEYIDNFEWDVIDWAAALRKVQGTTLKDSYREALERYMRLGCGIVPKSAISDLCIEADLFERIREFWKHQDSIEDKISLAEALEEIGDLHRYIAHDICDIIEKEYCEAFEIYQSINEYREHTFTMLGLLSKASKNYFAHGKVTEARRMYSKLYDFLCLYIADEDEDDEWQKYEIDIAYIMTDYASFLESEGEAEKAISVYEHTLSFCDMIEVHEQMQSKAIRCDVMLKIARIYENINRVDEAVLSYRKAIEYCLVEEKDCPGSYVVYLILLLKEFAEMLKEEKSYEDSDAAIAYYLDIIYSDPENYDALIQALPEFNWIAKAMDKVEMMRDLEDNYLLAEALEELAAVQIAYKEFAAAIESYKELVSTYVDMDQYCPGICVKELADAYYLLAVTYKEVGLDKEVEQSLEEAKELYKRLAESNVKYRVDVAKCLRAQLDLYEQA